MINVIGLGYIGLPTALMMASHGVEVIGTDYNKELVATLNAGNTTFKEDGLDELFQDLEVMALSIYDRPKRWSHFHYNICVLRFVAWSSLYDQRVYHWAPWPG